MRMATPWTWSRHFVGTKRSQFKGLRGRGPRSSGSGKGVHHAHARGREMIDVSGDDGQIMDERRSRTSLVDRIRGIGDTQSAPPVSRFLTERQDPVRIGDGESQQPPLEASGLHSVAAVSDALHALTQLANGDGREIKLRL